MDFKELGRPDLVIYNDDSVFLIENKYYAPYSNENQISRYIKILDKHFSSCSRKEVFLLTIANRVEHYKEKVKKDLDASNINCGKIKVDYLLWETILKNFESDNFVINNLANFIEKRFFISTQFSQEEIMVLSNNQVPKALDKIFSLIPIVRTILSNSFPVERMSQSYNYYGFHIRGNSLKAWFGYFFPLWLTPPKQDKCTPYYLQIREDWVNEGMDLLELKRNLVNLGFTYHPDFHWVKPYELDILISSNSDAENNSDNLAQWTEFDPIYLAQAIRRDLDRI